MSEFERVLPASEVPEGSLVAATLSTGDVVCVFNHRGTIGAVQDECTHAAFSLSDGTLLSDGRIECAWHGAQFDCRSGAVMRGPATDPLFRYDVDVRDGFVCIRATVRAHE